MRRPIRTDGISPRSMRAFLSQSTATNRMAIAHKEYGRGRKDSRPHAEAARSHPFFWCASCQCSVLDARAFWAEKEAISSRRDLPAARQRRWVFESGALVLADELDTGAERRRLVAAAVLGPNGGALLDHQPSPMADRRPDAGVTF
jgi:hypothetical protein